MSSLGAGGADIDPGDPVPHASTRLWRVAAFRGGAERPGSLAWRLWRAAPGGGLDFHLEDARLSPLLVACVAGSANLCSALLGWGADPDLADDAGWTPLHWCAISGRLECARALLGAGADPRAGLGSMETPLHFCASSSHWACADLIARAGGSFDDVDPATMGSAAHFGAHEPEALSRAGRAGLPAADSLGRSALHWAVARARDDEQAAKACSAWLTLGADAGALDARGVSASRLCAERGWPHALWALTSAIEREALSQSVLAASESGSARL